MKNLVLIVGVVLAMRGVAMADVGPSLEISSGSQSTSVDLPSEGDGIWGFTTPKNSPMELTLNGSTIKLSWVMLDSDPTVSYGVAAINNTSSTQTYSFTFTTPVSLAAGQYAVSSTAAGTLTDGGSDGAIVSLPLTGAIQQSFVASSNAGVDLLTSQITSPPGATVVVPTSTSSGVYSLGSPATSIDVITSFQLSAGDSATFSGRFDIASVPEPRSIGLGVICAGVFAFLIVRRRRNA